MKLASFSTQILAVPEDDPLAGAIETPGATRPVVTLSLRTDDGHRRHRLHFLSAAR